MKQLFAAFGICLLGTPLAATDLEMPSPLLDKVETATSACAEFENGVFSLEWSAVSRVDLDGDLIPDWVLNEAGFSCSSAASLYCGTGGCVSHFLVGDTIASLTNRGWDMEDLGPHRVLLVDVHGSVCGGIGPTPCIVSSVWDSETGRWQTAAAIWE